MNSPRTDLTPDALDETRRRVALVAAPWRLLDIDTEVPHPLIKEVGRFGKSVDQIQGMIVEAHELLKQGRVKEGARLFIDATKAAESAATADETDTRPHWLLAFAWFGLGNAAEQGADAAASAISYKRAFFRMAKAFERHSLSSMRSYRSGPS